MKYNKLNYLIKMRGFNNCKYMENKAKLNSLYIENRKRETLAK